MQYRDPQPRSQESLTDAQRHAPSSLASIVPRRAVTQRLNRATGRIVTVEAPAGYGKTSQVRACADALVGLAKAEGISVLVTGHVTKDGDLAGPRTLEHAVDVVLAFEEDPRSGQRMLSAGKNRFGAEGEVAWFEMTGSPLASTSRYFLASSYSAARRRSSRRAPPRRKACWVV